MRSHLPTTGATPLPLLLALGLLVGAVAACTPKAAGVRIGNPALDDAVGLHQRRSAAPAMPMFDDPVPGSSDKADTARARIAAAAGRAVGRRSVVVDGVKFRADCSGVARGIYAAAGLPLGEIEASEGATNDTRVLFELVDRGGSLRRARPLPGDLVFFNDTYDQDRDGVRDDPLSHVGVVEAVDDDGTVRFVHRVGGGIVRYRLNLDQPHDRKDPRTGKVWNHYLRRAEGAVPAKTTAELFVAFGTIVVDDRDGPLVASR